MFSLRTSDTPTCLALRSNTTYCWHWSSLRFFSVQKWRTRFSLCKSSFRMAEGTREKTQREVIFLSINKMTMSVKKSQGSGLVQLSICYHNMHCSYQNQINVNRTSTDITHQVLTKVFIFPWCCYFLPVVMYYNQQHWPLTCCSGPLVWPAAPGMLTLFLWMYFRNTSAFLRARVQACKEHGWW